MKLKVAFGLVCLSLVAQVQSNVSGVSPQVAQHYVKGKRFSCLDGSKEISFAEVNDDFCDCLDGSDEPGTGACAQGKFFCLNAGHQSLEIPPSFVGDGICDCCDGSDEPPGRCKNNCEEKGRAARLAAIEKEKILKEGSSIKDKIISDAQTSLANSKETLEKLRISYSELEGKVEKLRKLKEKEEEKARKAEELKKKMSGQFTIEQCETLSAYTKEVKTELDDLFRILTEKNEQGEIFDKIVKLRESFPSNLDCNPTLVPEEQKEEEETEAPMDDDYGYEDDSEGDIWEYVIKKVNQFHRKSRQLYNLITGEEDDEDDDDDDESSGDTYADKLRDVQNRLSKIKTNIEKQEKLQSLDFGVDKEYFSLYGECFSLVNNEYKYELCPFNKVTQANKNGGSATDLGKWEKWDDRFTMKYSGGQGCWQGPNRSTAVKLECGVQTEIMSVEEPAKCEYLMKVKTPAACQFGEPKEQQQEPPKAHSHEGHHQHSEL